MEQDRGFLMDEPTWGQRVKTYRLRARVTQLQLAELLRTDPATVARWESREQRPWSPISERFLRLEEELETEEAS